MNFVDLIVKKRDKLELTKEEIQFFVDSVTNQKIEDYQITSMLMAIFLNGMSETEISNFTLSMAYSGKRLDLSSIDGVKVDKHSTGGIADTTTLILAPLVASLGIPVVKMSGRGLGYTGGTIDKLNAIPNFKTDISDEEAISFAKKSNLVLMSQTKDLAPADGKLYSLRDVTGTVENLPLIAASIMSKKIAAGTDAIVLDVKCGSGAFMKTIEEANLLGEEMVRIGKNVGVNVVAIITSMDQPLGNYIGNSFEVIEAIETLKGNIKGDLLDVSIELGSYIVKSAKLTDDLETARDMLLENISNGKGLDKFKEMIVQQGGNAEVIDNYELMPTSQYKFLFKANENGYIYNINSEVVGKAFIETGAGRKTKSDIIDYGAGIIMKSRLGDKVIKGDVIAEIYIGTEDKSKIILDLLNSAIEIKEIKPNINSLILNVIS